MRSRAPRRGGPLARLGRLAPAARAARAAVVATVALGAVGACASPGLARRTVGADAFEPPGRGTLFIVGGGPRPRAVDARFVALAGGARARIVVLAEATADTGAGPAGAAHFRALGAGAARHVPAPRAAADSAAGSVVAALDSATGIWFPGGDQNRIMAALGGTPAAEAIRRRYEQGAVVGGTSAGAAVMSATMITGEERRPGGARPLAADARDAWVTIERDDVATAPGLGLLRGAIVDQHFVRRRRHNRLLGLVLERSEAFGVGVDESTALIVEPSGRWSVVGESVVVVYDGRPAFVTRSGPLGGAGVLVHVLTPGSTYDPRTNRVTFP